MGFAEKRTGYWRGRYKVAPGKYDTVKDDNGRTVKFRTRREAEQAADAAEAKVRAGETRSASDPMTFGAYANVWFDRLDLAPSTMQNYRNRLEEHLLPAFQEHELRSITEAEVRAWEQRERALDYAESSIKSWRALLHLVLADAQSDGLMASNPATRRRGRGKRAGRSQKRAPEKTITTVLGVLLIAERLALLSGRDEEFVLCLLLAFTGMRFGEMVGLETRFVRQDSIRIEWQLYELDTGELVRCPPKDDSYRTVFIPAWLAKLVREHIARAAPTACACHGFTYVFSGHRPANKAAQRPGPKLVDVARRAGVAVGTVSNVLNGRVAVSDGTREKVEAAIRDLGYVRGASGGELAAHQRRSGFATWLFQPAVTGKYPQKAPLLPRPVPILGEPWPGVPIRGRNSALHADACWLPIAAGLTPHGFRHTYKTVMEELGTPAPLMDDQIGHEDGSIQARYSHTTATMVATLMAGLTGLWEDALDARRRMRPGSPVAVLDRLLREEQ
ncbi:LacI family DNA-binding transcriptional regulator [Dactylosporangium sp. NPDC050588]|uniref:LacI family DNA-binding transcriptional regulator n=1 Tax=Dactylosporangium sp. NPDC050588 TaxID=3157211 RepID=UPI0033DDF134